MDLFPKIKAFRSEDLTVDDIHQLYIEQSGNPNGIPVVFLHGGPGAGTSEVYRRFFNPELYRIILFYQRGSGRSKPFSSIVNNTTEDLINDIMASKEMYIGRHYIKREKWVAAINRFKTVTEDYQTTIYVEEAIHRLVEIYYRIGLIEESKKYANLLGYNYLSSDWYKKSYKIFDQDIRKPKIKIEKNSLLKKFKKLF